MSQFADKPVLRLIAEAQAMGNDLLLGGVSWTRDVLQVRDEMFWVSAFNGMQFSIAFVRQWRWEGDNVGVTLMTCSPLTCGLRFFALKAKRQSRAGCTRA